MNKTELRARQSTLLAQARALFDEAGTTTDEARAADLERQHDEAMAEYDGLERRAAREDDLERRTRDADERTEREARARRPNADDREARGGGDQDGGDLEASYRYCFARAVCDGGDHNLSSEQRGILREGAAKFEQRSQTGASNTAGGYVIPTTILPFIAMARKASGPMYERDDVFTVIETAGGGSMKLPTVDDTGSTAVTHTEGTALTDDGSKDIVLGQKSLDAFAYDTEFVKWSWELDADSIIAFEMLLGKLLGKRMGRLANGKLTTGTGAGEPNGIVTASALGKTGASATAIAADEIIDLEHSVDPEYRGNAFYMFSDPVLQAIRKLKDGQGNYLWQQGDVTKGVPGTLNGYRYLINQDMSQAFTTGQKLMLFGDFSEYYVRKVGQPIIGVLRERFWPDVGIAGLLRFDGETSGIGAIKHYKLA